jgi:hypothetical protein
MRANESISCFLLPAETKVMVPEDLMMYVTGA